MRSLLQHLLSVAQVAAPLRRSLRVALATDDHEALQRHGRLLVSGLMRRGDLVRVTVSDGRADDGCTFALRDHSALLDLSPLLADTRDPQTANERGAVPDPMSTFDPALHERLLNAMERAQDHTVARSSGHSAAAILQDVIDLLDPTFPQAELHIELFGATDVPDPLANIGTCPHEARPFWATTRMEGEAVWLPAHRELPPWVRERVAPETEPGGFAAGVAVPLYPPREATTIESGAAIGEAGLLYVIHITPIARETLINLALRVSRFVTNGWRQTLQMSRLVHTDTLTGVHNRAFFDAQFPLELERAHRREAPLVLLLGDIDHFKDINDRFGHPAGDRVLQSVARELLEGLRRIDIVCRVGGEEFALVLPDTDIEAARDIVTRIQVRIANLRLDDPGAEEPLRVTISFGGVSYPAAGDTPEELYRNADRMLYLSKQRGRNRCHFWNPDGDPILTLPRYSAPAD
ncbi:GGDEF domain-containing protein [bacterium]|nr:GGDEF domain-containing protein [bacterium]